MGRRTWWETCRFDIGDRRKDSAVCGENENRVRMEQKGKA